jgi:hypothetical protein
MAINFPDTPTDGDTFTTGGRTFRYSGGAWRVVLLSAPQAGTTIYDTPGSIAGTMTTVTPSVVYDETLTGAELSAVTADIRITLNNYDDGMTMGPWNKNSTALAAATVSAMAAVPVGAFVTAGETTTPASTTSYVNSSTLKYDTASDKELFVYPVPVGPLVDYEESLTAGVYFRIQYTVWQITPDIPSFQTLWDTGLYELVFNGSSITTPHSMFVSAGVVELTCYGPTFTTGQSIELRLKNQPILTFTRDDGALVKMMTDRSGGIDVTSGHGRVRLGHSGSDLFDDSLMFEVENTVDGKYTGMALTNYSTLGESADLWFKRAESAPGDSLGSTASGSLGNIYWAGVSGGDWTPEWKIECGETYFSIEDLDTNVEHLRLGSSWFTWTPTLSGTGWAIGNGTIAARYCRVGRLITANIYVLFGSTSTFGTGEPQVNIFPSGAVSTNVMSFVNVQFTDASPANTYLGMASVALSSTAASCYIIPKSIGTNGLRTAISNTAPFTWASGDAWRIWFQYEASA